MNTDDVIEFLTWLESISPIRLEFTDKEGLAQQFTDWRYYRSYSQYKEEKK